MYGIVDVYVDGGRVGGSFDGYWPGVDSEGEQFSFGEVDLGPGEHEITMKLVDKNEKSTGTIISIKRWLLRSVEGK
jgi:hypothetical protein